MAEGNAKTRWWRAGRWLLAIIALAGAAEVFTGWLLWQRGGPMRLATVTVAEALPRAWERMTAGNAAPQLAACVTHDTVRAAVFAPRNTMAPQAAAVRQELETRYRAEFTALVRTAQARGTAVVVLYPPMVDDPGFPHRAIFEGLAVAYGVPIVRVSIPDGVADTDFFLVPADPHPSRLGHRLIAQALLPAVTDLASHRATPMPGGPPAARLGSLPPGVNEVVTSVPSYPYRLRSNAQGLRMNGIVPRNADRQVVLLLGNSFTYGTPLNAPDITAARLAAALGDRIVANGGIGGTGIEEARFIFETYWTETRADILVLQVLDNDIEALLWTASSSWFMPRPARAPTAAERALLELLAARC